MESGDKILQNVENGTGNLGAGNLGAGNLVSCPFSIDFHKILLVFILFFPSCLTNMLRTSRVFSLLLLVPLFYFSACLTNMLRTYKQEFSFSLKKEAMVYSSGQL